MYHQRASGLTNGDNKMTKEAAGMTVTAIQKKTSIERIGPMRSRLATAN
jgi:hypothetical protein